MTKIQEYKYKIQRCINIYDTDKNSKNFIYIFSTVVKNIYKIESIVLTKKDKHVRMKTAFKKTKKPPQRTKTLTIQKH